MTKKYPKELRWLVADVIEANPPARVNFYSDEGSSFTLDYTRTAQAVLVAIDLYNEGKLDD